MRVETKEITELELQVGFGMVQRFGNELILTVDTSKQQKCGRNKTCKCVKQIESDIYLMACALCILLALGRVEYEQKSTRK